MRIKVFVGGRTIQEFEAMIDEWFEVRPYISLAYPPQAVMDEGGLIIVIWYTGEEP